ncbi:uncharacterized protein LOC113465001 [Ceratina calcarata]|uniref:Uncharacterized protein LOC113465001 n=1 Tax=Ceratina calcarata TaxID=156304 RepID=A0AAJ7SB15_9HYME|nr:uncharacterized protein LOC113465001 [Ceratina calcarata]
MCVTKEGITNRIVEALGKEVVKLHNITTEIKIYKTIGTTAEEAKITAQEVTDTIGEEVTIEAEATVSETEEEYDSNGMETDGSNGRATDVNATPDTPRTRDLGPTSTRLSSPGWNMKWLSKNRMDT